MKNLNRCDNCFFSVWVINPNRPLLICMQKKGRVGRWWGVLSEDTCTNFYPSETVKKGAKAARPIPLTRGKFALVDAEDYYQLAQFKWHTETGTKTFYAVRNHAGKQVKMHRAIMAAPSHLLVDHINHNGLDNRKANLRLCTRAQNNCNVVSRKGSASKYKGVNWYKVGKKWTASVRSNKKFYHLGYFTDETAAARAYDKRASQLHGRFACLNFPQACLGEALAKTEAGSSAKNNL